MDIKQGEVIFNDQVHFLTHPKVYVDTFKASVGTPSIKNRTVFKSPSGATTITNFLEGTDGQTIRILGNGNLTVNNNTTIKTNTAANKVLAANKIYTFTLVSGVWYESE